MVSKCGSQKAELYLNDNSLIRNIIQGNEFNLDFQSFDVLSSESAFKRASEDVLTFFKVQFDSIKTKKYFTLHAEPTSECIYSSILAKYICCYVDECQARHFSFCLSDDNKSFRACKLSVKGIKVFIFNLETSDESIFKKLKKFTKLYSHETFEWIQFKQSNEETRSRTNSQVLMTNSETNKENDCTKKSKISKKTQLTTSEQVSQQEASKTEKKIRKVPSFSEEFEFNNNLVSEKSNSYKEPSPIKKKKLSEKEGEEKLDARKGDADVINDTIETQYLNDSQSSIIEIVKEPSVGKESTKNSEFNYLCEKEDLRKEARIDKITDLTKIPLDFIDYMIRRDVNYYVSIFAGKCEHSWRHEEYKKLTNKSSKILYQNGACCSYTPEQQLQASKTLESIFCRNDKRYVDYVCKVLLPESLIKICMRVFQCAKPEAEEYLHRNNLTKPIDFFDLLKEIQKRVNDDDVLNE